MKTYSAREIMKKAYGSSKNFMTPHIIRYGKISRTLAYEFSYGSGMEPGTTLYGVTVAGVTKGGKGVRAYKLSESFHSKSKAENYISRLKIKYGGR